MTDHLRRMPEFLDAVRARLAKGAVEYGNKSFSANPAHLVEELKQEALDLAGWGYVLYCRLQAIQEAIDAAAAALTARGDGDTQPPTRMVGADRARLKDPTEGLCL